MCWDLDEVGGYSGSAAQSSVHVEQSSDDADVVEVGLRLFHGVDRLQHRPEAPDARLVRLLQRQTGAEPVCHLRRLHAHTVTPMYAAHNK